MTQIIIIMAIAGIVAGFVFSMPIAGPISILITSNAFKGKRKCCNQITVGASFADFFYVLVAFFGLTKLYTLYKPLIPYILCAGALFIIYTGYKVIKTKVDPENIGSPAIPGAIATKKEANGFYTGFMINFLNPTLFFGWLTTSFFVISFVSALGLNTGGLDTIINKNVREINIMENGKVKDSLVFHSSTMEQIRSHNIEIQKKENVVLPRHFPLIISVIYAFSLSLGSILWFYLLAYLITRFRKHINLKIINGIVYSMGVALCLLGVYFGYVAAGMLLHLGH
ncbi:MAG TPA: LysE family transporter [Bacteroidales bacterium]|nr:LysE family transporter [Bacteroidales bacterium]